MNYLDVNPMIDSLRAAPEDFSLKGKWLLHRRSGHRFGFDEQGRVQIRAVCECAELMVKPELETALYNRFREWESGYWHPLVINRQFAAHFRPLPAWRKVLLRLTTSFAKWLAEDRSEPEAAVTEELKTAS